MHGAGLLGPASLLAQQGFKWQFFWATLGLVGALLAGALFVALLERWRKRAKEPGVGAGDQLSHFRELYEAGTISKQEYELIRGRLAGELRKELDLESPATNPAPAAPVPPTN